MSRTQKNWGWLSAAAALLIAIMGWAFSVSANSLSRTEAQNTFATKAEFNMLYEQVKEVGRDIKELLVRNPKPEYGPSQR